MRADSVVTILGLLSLTLAGLTGCAAAGAASPKANEQRLAGRLRVPSTFHTRRKTLLPDDTGWYSAVADPKLKDLYHIDMQKKFGPDKIEAIIVWVDTGG